MEHKSMSEPLDKNMHNNKQSKEDDNRQLYLHRDSKKAKYHPHFTQFIGQKLWKIVDMTNHNKPKFREQYVKWGTDSDYDKCNEDFKKARLYNLHPLHFVSKALVIIVDRLFEEYMSVKSNDIKNSTKKTEDMHNIGYCVTTLKLLLRPKSEWIQDRMTQGYYATLIVRGYCYKKLLEIYRRTDQMNSWSEWMERAKEDSDITKDYKIELCSDEEPKGTKKINRDDNNKIYMTSPGSASKISSIFQVYTRVVNHERLTGTLKGNRVLYHFKHNIFKKTLSIHNNNDNDDDNDINIDDAIIKQKAYDEIHFRGKDYTYGRNVEEFAADYYSGLIANNNIDNLRNSNYNTSSNTNSNTSAILQMALPYTLQEKKGFFPSAVIKCKVIKETETWVGAFSEGKLWFEALYLFMLEDMMIEIPYLTNIRNFQRYPLDWPDLLFEFPQPYGAPFIQVQPHPFITDFKMFSRGFFERRKETLGARLEALRIMNTKSLRMDFNHRWSLAQSRRYLLGTSRDTLYTFSIALGGERLANVFEAILKEPHVYYRGYPDLSFWKCDNDKINSKMNIEIDDNEATSSVDDEPIKMSTSNNYQRENCSSNTNTTNTPWINDNFFAVEVKSENDRLSKYQDAVNEMLNNAGIHIEVLKVLPNSS